MAQVILVVISTVLSAASGQQASRPTEEALAKAQQQVREVYGASMHKAKKPAEQSALARILLEDSLKIDDDPAGQFILLTTARSLAIAAKDRQVAIEIVTAVAERFKPNGPTDPGEQIKQGDELSAAAKKGPTAKRLGLQVEAAEWYVRAKLKGTGLHRQLAEKRLAELAEPPEGKRNGKANDLNVLIGTWEVRVGSESPVQWTFTPDGVVTSNRHSPRGRWTANASRVEVKWDDNAKAWDIFLRPLDPTGVVGDSWAGPGILHAKKVPSGRR